MRQEQLVLVEYRYALVLASVSLLECDASGSFYPKGVAAAVEGVERDIDFLHLVSQPFAALPSPRRSVVCRTRSTSAP